MIGCTGDRAVIVWERGYLRKQVEKSIDAMFETFRGIGLEFPPNLQDWVHILTPGEDLCQLGKLCELDVTDWLKKNITR